MKNPIVFMFSGQGSHYYQMGRELFERQLRFKYWMESADNFFHNLTGFSVIKELYSKNHKKTDPFLRVLFTNPAIFMIEYALSQVLIEQGIYPDYVLGSSLGEFSAAAIAGIMSFESSLNAVVTQAQMLEEKCTYGSMLAIFYDKELYENNLIFQKNSELAAVNFSSHFVISGKTKLLKKVETYLQEKKIAFQWLNVNHAFHFSSMDSISDEYIAFMRQQSVWNPSIPFISCVTSKTHLSTIPITHFWDAIRLPIQFQTTIQTLESRGNYCYLDVGPSGTMSTFVKYNLELNTSSQVLSTLTPFGGDLDNIEKVKDILVR